MHEKKTTQDQTLITFESNEENTINLKWEAKAFVKHLNQAYIKKFKDSTGLIETATKQTISLIDSDSLDFEISLNAMNSINEIEDLPDNIRHLLNIPPSFFQKTINFFKNLVSTEIENQPQQEPLKYQTLINNLNNVDPQVKNKILDQLRPEINSHVTKTWFQKLDPTVKKSIQATQEKREKGGFFASFLITSLIASIGASLYFPQLIITGSLIAPIIVASIATLALSSIIFKLLEKSTTEIRYITTISTLLLCTALSLSLFFPIINIINIGILIAIFATGIAIGYGLYKYTVPEDYSQMKKIFKTTSAYNETINYNNTFTSVNVTIENPHPELNSHNKNQWEDKTAQRPITYKQTVDDDKYYSRSFIRTPSIANPKAKAKDDIPKIKQRLKDIFSENGGTYNLLTSIYPSFLNPFAWEDNAKNKQTISAGRIFAAANMYNRERHNDNTHNNFVYIQNIGSNYHTEPLDNHPEACLLADMSLLHTLNPNYEFKEYKQFLQDTKAGDILNTTTYGQKLRTNIDKAFYELESDKNDTKFENKIRNALIIIVRNRLHYKPEFGNITQVLSIFLQTAKAQRTAFGCKSGNERFVDVANKVLLLFEADGLNKYEAKEKLITKLNLFTQNETDENLTALDTKLAKLCSQNNVAGPMNLITNSDNGANSKLKKIKNKSLISKIENCARITVFLAIAILIDIIVTGIIESGIFSLASFAALNPITITICALLTLSIVATVTMKIKPEWTKQALICTGALLTSAIAVLAISNSFTTLFVAFSAATIVAICLVALMLVFATITGINKNAINTNCGTMTTVESKHASVFQSHKAFSFVANIFANDTNNNKETPSLSN